MKKGDDDETTSQRDRDAIPRSPVLPPEAPERPTLPAMPPRSRTSTRKGVSPEPIDDGPTIIDPEVPTGARDRPRQFDPTARVDDNRKTTPRAATSPPVELEDLPVSGPTMVGKINANVGPKKAQSGPRVAPVPPLPPEERPSPKDRAPVKFDPHQRIDDSSRTNKWEAAQLDPLATPPVQMPLPPILPLQPGPQSAPIQVVSMKTPQEVEEEKTARPLPEVRLRAMSDVRQTPPRGMGFLAPPLDPKDVRSRRRRDVVIWGSVAVIVASVVTLAVWFLAR